MLLLDPPCTIDYLILFTQRMKIRSKRENIHDLWPYRLLYYKGLLEKFGLVGSLKWSTPRPALRTRTKKNLTPG